ncbi:MAG: hypothetical protein OHK0046_20570 [Anaerolineae bacterium]
MARRLSVSKAMWDVTWATVYTALLFWVPAFLLWFMIDIVHITSGRFLSVFELLFNLTVMVMPTVLILDLVFQVERWLALRLRVDEVKETNGMWQMVLYLLNKMWKGMLALLWLFILGPFYLFGLSLKLMGYAFVVVGDFITRLPHATSEAARAFGKTYTPEAEKSKRLHAEAMRTDEDDEERVFLGDDGELYIRQRR